MEVKEPSQTYLAAAERRQTEIGLLPSDWSAERLGSVSTCLIGLTYSPTDVADHGTLVLRSSNVQGGRLAFSDCVFVQMDLPARVVTREGDLLVCVRNGSRSLIGKAALIDSSAAGSAFGAFMSVLRSNDGKYLRQVFDTASLKRQIEQGMGATINQITNRDMDALLVPWPPSAEERGSIGSVLTDADALIDSLEQLLTKKRQIKQGAMQELLTGKRRLPGFTSEWRASPLGTLLAIRHGKSQKEVESDSGEYPILATGGQIGWANAFLYDRPTVLIGRKGTIDQPRYMESPFWSVDTLYYSEVKEPHNAKFLYYRFCLIDWMQHNEASGVPSLSAKVIESIAIAHPEQDEQTAIATVLTDMDAEIAAVESRLTKARAIKQAMAQALLTGRIRLMEPTA